MKEKVIAWNENGRLIEYVKNDKKSVPYLYVDLVNYKKDDLNVNLYVDEEGGMLNGISLQYYDCLHFYTNSPEKYSVQRITELIDSLRPHTIMLQEQIGEKIKGYINNSYSLEINYILDMDQVFFDNREYVSKFANREDIEMIVDLLLTEDEYSVVYSKAILLKQMLSRFDEGIGRHIIVKDGVNVVAESCTYGETEDMAIIGGTIVHRDYRRQGYAMDVVKHICSVLHDEEKSCVVFINVDNIPSIELHKKIGAEPYAKYYKFIKRV